MVRGSIHQQNNTIPPTCSILRRELNRQLRQEHLHQVLVCVALRLWNPHNTLRWQSKNDVDFMSQWSRWHRVSFTNSAPTLSLEIGNRHPTLVYVHNMIPFRIELEHLACVDVSENLASFGVSSMRDPLNTFETQLEPGLQDIVYSSKWHLRITILACE